MRYIFFKIKCIFLFMFFILKHVFSNSSTDFHLSETNLNQNLNKKCLFSQTCATKTKFGIEGSIPCFFEHEPYKLNGTDYDITKKLCPDLFQNNNRHVCCDMDQINKFKNSIKLPKSLLSNCPTCYYNFLNLFCQMTCSPYQSTFIDVLEKEPCTNKSDKYKFQIKKISYSVNATLTDNVYQSCKNVNSPLDGKAIDIICRSENCNEDYLLKQLGDPDVSPFEIDFVFYKKDGTYYYRNNTLVPIAEKKKPPIQNSYFKCNEKVNFFSSLSCTCLDCPEIKEHCSSMPDYPKEKKCFVYGKFECSQIALIVFYFTILALILFFYLCYLFSKNNLQDNNNTISDAIVSTADLHSEDSAFNCEDRKLSNRILNFRSKLNICFSNFFYKWTFYCVQHPNLVISIGISFVILLSLGLFNFQVVSDPVELWSSPSSQSRIQKKFFDDVFHPFYRVEQIIIKNFETKNESFIYNKKLYSGVFTYEFLNKIYNLQTDIVNLKAEKNNQSVHLHDICFSALNNGICTIQSTFGWFQENLNNFKKDSYMEKVSNCLKSKDISCYSSFGGPVYSNLILGGYNNSDYQNATSLIITILVNNHNNTEQNSNALLWEKVFVDYMKDYVKNHNSNNFSISYFSERSIEDELERQSLSDVTTILISYTIMFIYVSLSLGQKSCSDSTFINMKINFSLVGVLIVLASVLASLGFLSLCGFKATLIIIEVIPFLVLAVGVDNIFIIVQTLESEPTLENDTSEKKIARVMSKVGPSLLLAFTSEAACFFIGALSVMPCIQIFALNAALALIFDFLLQMTVFISFLALNSKKTKESCYEVLCCIKFKEENSLDNSPEENLTYNLSYNFFKNIYAPFLMKNCTRLFVSVLFLTCFVYSASNIQNISVGLDRELSMPKDSYVYKYFLDSKQELRVGPPVYFVVKNDLDMSKEDIRFYFCTETYCDTYSFLNLLSSKTNDNSSYIVGSITNWLFGYDKWIFSNNCFKLFPNGSYCGSRVPNRDSECLDIEPNEFRYENKDFIKQKYFYKYLEDFLQDDILIHSCVFAGKTIYGDSVKLTKNKTTVYASYYQTYHSVLSTSDDFINALKNAKFISNYLEENLNSKLNSTSKVEVFAYSVFYVFYEQFLTMWKHAMYSFSFSLLAISITFFILLGFDITNTLIMVVTVISVLVNILGGMYLWDISLNAVSLVNLVMSIGISVEFCSHIIHYFVYSSSENRVEKAQNSLIKIGPSILSGITLTKLVGILILSNAKSQIFQIFYFRMYLLIVLIGSTHGLILLPVILSVFGRKSKLDF